MNKIFCFGDGYASNHIWPEWPAIIAALYSDIECENFGAVGAGNEFISSAVIQNYIQNPNAFFLVQWADIRRFDKLVEDNSWNNVIDTDKTYSFNIVKSSNQTWWLSSQSCCQEVVQYHEKYIQNQQAQLRAFNAIFLMSKLLTKQAIFFSTPDMMFTTEQKQQLTGVLWIDIHMGSYSRLDRFSNIQRTHTQPSPYIHMNWVEEKILPLMPKQPDPARLQELKRRIFEEKWTAFDPDCKEKWNNLVDF